MKKAYIYISFWSFLIGVIYTTTIACETAIDLKIKDFEKNLVLNAVFEPDSSLILNLQWTQELGNPPPDGEDIGDILDSWVLLKDGNGGVIDTAQLCYNYYYNNNTIIPDYCSLEKNEATYVLPNLKFDYGKEYQIEILRTDGFSLNASCQTPLDFSIEFDPLDTFSTEFSGAKVFDFPVVIKDNPNENNFYIIEARSREVYSQYDDDYQAVGLYCLDPSCENSDIARQEDQYQRIFINDNEFNGVDHLLILKASKLFLEFPKIDGAERFLEVNISSVSEDLYKYYKGFERHERSYGTDIFAQPVQLHSNVSNELGILGAKVTKEVSFRVD
ncbi:MAG: DUF4249 family protein [Aureispira sp.]|nr:DUF4249 family protein [Aureispira sp.]